MEKGKPNKYYIPNLDTNIKVLASGSKKVIVNEKLPSLPNNMLVFARSNQGKTNCLLNLIHFYKKIFKDRIMIISKSYDESLETLRKSHNAEIFYDIYNENGENIIEKLIAYQKNRKARGEKLQHYLVLLEDMISDKSLNNKRTCYDTLFSMGRHLKITTIITSQSYTAIPSSLRRMCWTFLVFKITNQAEKKIMCAELCATLDLSETEFEKVYNEAIREPYAFMLIDCAKNKYSHCFNGFV